MQPAQPLPRTEATKRFTALRGGASNDRCAECRARDTTWVVLDYGVLICVQCAGAHRGLGTHISQVRSTQHDNFTQSEMEWIESLGNAKSAALYEAALPLTMRPPTADSSEVVRRTWLRLKYDELMFTAGMDARTALQHESLCGWMLKLGGVGPFATWKKRFFRIRAGAILCYFTDESEGAPAFRGVQPLTGCTVDANPEDSLTLKLSIAKLAGSKGTPPSFTLRAATIEEAEAWAWAFYQCSHGAEARLRERSDLAAAVAPRAQQMGRKHQRDQIFSRAPG